MLIIIDFITAVNRFKMFFNRVPIYYYSNDYTIVLILTSYYKCKCINFAYKIFSEKP